MSELIISEVTRRDIIDYLLLRDYPYYGRLDLISFLKRIWDLSSMPSTDNRFRDAEGDIWQHMVNKNDWNHEYLLTTYLGLLRCSSQIFIKFLENCLDPVVISDELIVSESLFYFNKKLSEDGFIIGINHHISGKPVYTAKKISKENNKASQEVYDVVLSFAGEDREYVEGVALCLKKSNLTFFYDKYEEVDLWGKDLYEHLDEIYRKKAKYCVMFLSEHFARKVWTNHERKSAQAKALENKKEYILPVRFDNTEIPGLRPTIGYIDGNKYSPEELAEMIVSKCIRE